MYDYYFTFRAILAAQKAIHALQNRGIRVSLIRSPKLTASTGCGYAIRVRQQNGEQAAAILRLSGIQFQKIFLSDTNGDFTEVWL